MNCLIIQDMAQNTCVNVRLSSFPSKCDHAVKVDCCFLVVRMPRKNRELGQFCHLEGNFASQNKEIHKKLWEM